MSDASNAAALPALEAACPVCLGTGGHREVGEWVDCFKCSGRGSLPTEAGDALLRFMQNNLKLLLADAAASAR